MFLKRAHSTLIGNQFRAKERMGYKYNNDEMRGQYDMQTNRVSQDDPKQ